MAKHRQHRTRQPVTLRVLDRFLAHINRAGDCWVWTGRVDKNGYGVFCVDGGDFRAHRVAYEVAHRVVPGDLYVCHMCDNPGCVNPRHLFLGTNAENTADRNAKGRQARGDRSGSRLHPERVTRGEACGASKLTAEAVAEIRAARAAGATQSELARKYGVTQGAISRIDRRTTWRHVA